MSEFIDKIELLQAIDKEINNAETKYEADIMFKIKDIVQKQYVFDLLKDLKPVDRWISCKEQMPEDGVSVLICSYRGTVSKATYDSDMGYFYIADSELHYNELDITHWIPLPEPPKDGDAE